MRTRTLLATGLGALAISVPGLGCGSGAESEPTSAPNAVAAVDFALDPEAAEIAAGETIHNVKGKGFFS